MFDVPVLEVTVSSAPILISNIRQANQTTLHTSPFASALLNASPVTSSEKHRLPSAIVGNLPTDATPNQAFLPNGPFQLLQPLNLADATRSLEKVFEDSLTEIPSQEKSSRRLTVSAPTGPSQQPSTSSGSQADGAAVRPPVTTLPLQPAISNSQKSVPELLPRQTLQQCIDVPYEANSTGITKLQVVLRGNLIGEVSTTDGAASVVQSLQTLLANEQVNPSEIIPVLDGDQSAIRLSSDIIVQIFHQAAVVDDKSTLSKKWAAIVWSDELRQKMGAPPLDAGNIQVLLKALKPSEEKLNGIASWYGPYFHGRKTANGEIFDQNTLTAAHKSLPFNTVLQVRNLKNDRTVVVRINDRGPYIGKRSLDLSKAAAQCLGSETVGIIPYEALILEQENTELPENSD